MKIRRPLQDSIVSRFRDRTQEQCGVIVHTYKSGTRLHKLSNTHEDPQHYFRVSMEEARSIIETHEFLALFHTHIDRDLPEPSEYDFMQLRQLRTKYPNVVGVVYNVPRGLLVQYDGIQILSRLLIPDRQRNV